MIMNDNDGGNGCSDGGNGGGGADHLKAMMVLMKRI